MKKRNSSKIICLIFSVSLVFSILFWCIHFFSFNENFYISQHLKLKINETSISEYIGISDKDLNELTSFTLNYLNQFDATLDKKLIIKGELKEVFNQNEKLHMNEIKNINISLSFLFIVFATICFISCLLIKIKKININDVFYWYKQTFINTMIISICISLWCLFDFDSFFNLFHNIFFNTKTWILDIKTDILMMMFPNELFIHLVSRIIITFVLVSIAIFIFLYFTRKKIAND